MPRLLSIFLALILLASCGPAALPPAPTATVAPTATPTILPTATATVPPTVTAEPPPLYLDPSAPTQARVDDLLARMTLAEKIGQMTQIEKNSISPEMAAKYFLGSILSGGGGYPNTANTVEEWIKMVDGYQAQALQTRLGIPILYGVDAVHGHNNLWGAVIFPHNIGLGAANDPALVERIARATAEEMLATGARWNFAPTIAVPQDIRWGRTYEGYSENTELVTRLGVAYVRGLQSAGVLPSIKHYIGDGGTKWGTSLDNFRINAGDTQVDEAALRRLFLPPYQAAIQAGAQNVMISYNSWNGVRMHAHRYLITEVLKGELGFSGFTVSDYEAIDDIPGDYYTDVVTSINAGLDMIMVPRQYKTFVDTLTLAVEKGDVPLERIDDAVRRILTVKIELGLFERPYADPALRETVGSDAHRALAREAVAKSLVLLQNENAVLPLAKDAATIYVGGQAADDIGMQCGGWTIEWQGATGDITPGTTILEAVQAAVGAGTRVVYDPKGQFADQAGLAEIGIAVVGERPYAEGSGDRAELDLSETDQALIESMRARSEKLVVILLSGRPMTITGQLAQADAWVAAWLPGTEGAGVADVLFGDRPFTGKLPYTWPRSVEQLPLEKMLQNAESDPPLFDYGFGLE